MMTTVKVQVRVVHPKEETLDLAAHGLKEGTKITVKAHRREGSRIPVKARPKEGSRIPVKAHPKEGWRIPVKDPMDGVVTTTR
jgi:hypothetical protein